MTEYMQVSMLVNTMLCFNTRYLHTVSIGEEDTMVNKILVVDKIVHLGPPLGHCRGLLYKIVW